MAKRILTETCGVVISLLLSGCMIVVGVPQPAPSLPRPPRKGRSIMEQEGNLPVYICRKAPRELRLTGKIDDLLWEKAQVVRLTQATTGEEPRYLTEARLLYSDTTLYIAFHCEDEYVWGTRTQHDADIWTEECVEVFISPAGTLHQYYEINVSPKNVTFDACILNPRLRAGIRAPFVGLWDYTVEGLKTVTHVEGTADTPSGAKYWNAEYAIPLDQLVGAPHMPPRPGDTWRINLYRIDSPKPGEQEFYAWSTLDIIDFHTPTRFGMLRFE